MTPVDMSDADLARCLILRPLTGPDGPLAAGTIVDVRGWRWARQLIERRYLRPVPVTIATGTGRRKEGGDA